MTNRPSAAQTAATLFDQPDRRDFEFGVQSSSLPQRPTTEVSAEWQFFFSYFNERLFDKVLPDCVATYTRHPAAQEHLFADAFRDRNGFIAHEMAMNPPYFHMGDTESFQTFVHEMTHLHGKRNRKGGHGAPGYHHAVWADRMEAMGLMPSDAGNPGGKRTGYYMGDYPIEGGPFDLAYRELQISGERINWRGVWPGLTICSTGPEAPASREPGTDPALARNTRTHFICPVCDVKVWARASARLACTDCDAPLLNR